MHVLLAQASSVSSKCILLLSKLTFPHDRNKISELVANLKFLKHSLHRQSNGSLELGDHFPLDFMDSFDDPGVDLLE